MVGSKLITVGWANFFTLDVVYRDLSFFFNKSGVHCFHFDLHQLETCAALDAMLLNPVNMTLIRFFCDYTRSTNK